MIRRSRSKVSLLAINFQIVVIIYIVTIITLIHYQHHFISFVVSSSNQYHSTSILHAPPISLKSVGFSKFISLRWYKAKQIALLEQYVDDWNADYIATSTTLKQSIRYRRLIALPLDDRFNPPIGVFSHNHIQTGDKVCLPSTFWSAIQLNNAEVPWLFSISRIPGVTSERVILKGSSNNKKRKIKNNIKQEDIDNDKESNDDDIDDNDKDNDDEFIISPYKSFEELDQVIAGPLDFRSPSNYIFLPLWMIRSLGLRPLDIVDVELIETVPPGSIAKLRPHTSQFSKDISNNPQAVLETELRHYSSLTSGTTIPFDYNNKRYWFDVIELRSSIKGMKENIIKVQDCDIITDFLTPKDILMEHLKKKKEKLKQQKQEQEEKLMKQKQQQQQ